VRRTEVLIAQRIRSQEAILVLVLVEVLVLVLVKS
jgi:hypothetical protein